MQRQPPVFIPFVTSTRGEKRLPWCSSSERARAHVAPRDRVVGQHVALCNIVNRVCPCWSIRWGVLERTPSLDRRTRARVPRARAARGLTSCVDAQRPDGSLAPHEFGTSGSPAHPGRCSTDHRRDGHRPSPPRCAERGRGLLEPPAQAVRCPSRRWPPGGASARRSFVQSPLAGRVGVGRRRGASSASPPRQRALVMPSRSHTASSGGYSGFPAPRRP